MNEIAADSEHVSVPKTRWWPALSVIALCRWRTRSSWVVRLASGAAWAVVLTAAWSVFGAQSGVEETLRPTLAALVWIGVGPLALVLAHDPEGRDRTEGVTDMLALRGVTETELRRARFLSSVFEAVRVIALPTLLLSAAVLSHGMHARSAALVAGMLGLCLATGCVVGSLASVCGRLAGKRGPGWMAAIIIVPWVLADALGQGSSLPMLLDACLDRLMGAG